MDGNPNGSGKDTPEGGVELFRKELQLSREEVRQLQEKIERLEKSIAESHREQERASDKQKRIGEIIERGKREWEATFDAVKAMIILTDDNGVVIRCNRSVLNYLNKGYADLIGSKIETLFICQGDTFVGEIVEIQFSQLPGWYSVSNYPVLVKDEPFGVVHIVEDVTERRQAQESLKKINDELEIRVQERSRELLQANQELQHEAKEREAIQAVLEKEKEMLAITLLSIRDGVISTDRHGVVTLFNQAAEQIFACPERDVVGKPLNEVMVLLEEKTGQAVADPLSKLIEIRPDESHLMNFYLLNREGTKLLISTSSAPVHTNDGDLIGYVMVIDNITEQKRMESQTALSQKLESIGQLAAGIAHEINTPMQYVGDNTHFLSDAFQVIFRLLQLHDELMGQTGGERAEILEKLKNMREEMDLEYYTAEVPVAIQQSLDGIERVRKIVLAMKVFSHPSNKEKQWASINQGIETTLTISRNEWKYLAELEKDLDPTLPAVYCEIDEINQVILNMIINAAHAVQERAEKGGPAKGKITISTRNLGERVQIKIQDTGSGIPPETIDRVFDPFFTTKDVGKGTGQGLALAHSIIVNQHKGHILVDSEVGKGTTFTILLPMGDPNLVEKDEGMQ